MVSSSYFLFNVLVPFVVSTLISATAMFVVRKDFDDYFTRIFIILIPGYFSMFFGDIMFAITYFLQNGNFSNVNVATGKAKFVHDLFNSYADFVAIPVVVLLVFGFVALIEKYTDRKIPKNWAKVVFWVATVSVIIATFVMDPLGF